MSSRDTFEHSTMNFLYPTRATARGEALDFVTFDPSLTDCNQGKEKAGHTTNASPPDVGFIRPARAADERGGSEQDAN